jgi:hypothetical protein
MECCICMDDNNRGMIGCDICTGAFHEQCIISMMLENEEYTGCPICRSILPETIKISIVQQMYQNCKWVMELPISGWLIHTLYSCIVCNSVMQVTVIDNVIDNVLDDGY